MRQPLLCLLLLCTSGCPTSDPSPSSIGTPDSVAGARLVPLYLVADDGAKMFSGRLLDTDFNVPCAPGSVGGKVVCYPNDGELVKSTEGIFVDPSCSARAAANASEAVLLTDHQRVFRKGAALSQVWERSNGECVQREAGPGTFGLGEDVTDTLVGMRESR